MNRMNHKQQLNATIVGYYIVFNSTNAQETQIS